MSSSSISVIPATPTLEEVTHAGNETTRSILMRDGQGVVFYDPTNAIDQAVSGVAGGLFIDSSIASPIITLRNSSSENVTIQNTTGILILSAKNANTPVRIGSGSQFGLPTGTSNPVNPAEGDMYINTDHDEIRVYTNGNWASIY